MVMIDNVRNVISSLGSIIVIGALIYLIRVFWIKSYDILGSGWIIISIAILILIIAYLTGHLGINTILKKFGMD